MEKKRARKLKAINSHADLFSSAAYLYMQQQTMSVQSTFETVRSRCQINKACYGYVYDFGYENIPS